MGDDSVGAAGSVPGEEYLVVLRKYFGHSQFRPMQWKIIRSIIEDRRDLCVVMATGYGKSLCYQYPAVFTGGVAIVISPLISLMRDQVLSLEVANIPACYLGSAQEKKPAVVQNILNNEYRLVYITPELCSSDYGATLLVKFSATLNVVLIAIDEAHCVSQWGFDFRTSYRKLGALRNYFPNVPLLTVTATATIQVCRDICYSLDLRNPLVIRTDFDRPNLYLGVSMKTPNDIFSDIRKFLKRNGLKWNFPGSTIIYCPTKKMAEAVSSVLNDNAVKCSVYHAELSMKKRNEVHEKFVRDEIQVISATVAFGMGIDKPDIRLVIHYGAPKDIESYYQEIGRAGRDGLPSTCHVFYSSADFTVNQYFISHLNGKYREHRIKIFKLIEKYLDSLDCRRDFIISYFDPGKTASKPEGVKFRSNCCDNCTERLENKRGSNCIDKTELRNDAVLMLKAVLVFDGNKGITTPISLLRGSRSQRLPAEYYQHKLFGAGKVKSEAWWKALGRLLLKEDLLEQKSFKTFNKFKIATIKVSSDGWKLIGNPNVYDSKLKPSNELLSLAKTERSSCSSFSKPTLHHSKNLLDNKAVSEQKDIKNNVICKPVNMPLSKEESELLYEMYYGLMKLRNDLAHKYGCMPYMIANNKMLMDLAKIRPKSKEELSKVEGFGQNKVDKFGDKIVEEIAELVENFKTYKNYKSVVNNDNDSEHNNLTALQSESLNVDSTLWGEEDDSFLMSMPFQVLSDFDESNCNDNSDDIEPDKTVINKNQEEDEIWPDLDLSTIQENFDEPNINYCENTAKPSLSTGSSNGNELYSSVTLDREASHKSSSYRHLVTKRKSKMIEFDDSDDSSTSNESSLENISAVSSEKRASASVVSKKPLPSWLNDPGAKKLLIKKMKTNSLFKI